MPSHIYSILGMWDESIRSNLASKAVAEAYGRPAVAHQVDFLVYAHLQMAEDAHARELVDSVLPVAGAAAAARNSGSVETAKRYYRALARLAAGGDRDRPEIAEARTYLAQN